jgi:Tfp pilus assembly protein PilZ
MAKNKKMKERRCFIRVPLSTKVQYASDAVADVRDLSQGGICIIANKDFTMGTPLVLDIVFPSGSDVQASGIIVRKKELYEKCFEYGLKFFTISQNGDYPLRLYIEESIKLKQERRKFKRFTVDVAVEYSLHGKAETRNIHHEGICIITDEKIAVGSIFILTLIFMKNRKVLTYGKVLWNRPISYSKNASGIRFWNITKKNKELLKEMISDARVLTTSF